MSWFARVASGYWIAPSTDVIPQSKDQPGGVEPVSGRTVSVSSHGDYAQELFKARIREEIVPEKQEIEITDPEKPEEPPKGTDGKDQEPIVQERLQEMGAASPMQATQVLVGEGWVQVRSDPSVLIVVAPSKSAAMDNEVEDLVMREMSTIPSMAIQWGEGEVFVLQDDVLSYGYKEAVDRALQRGVMGSGIKGMGPWSSKGRNDGRMAKKQYSSEESRPPRRMGWGR